MDTSTTSKTSDLLPLLSTHSERADRIVSWLTYAGLDAEKRYDGEGDSYTVMVRGNERILASGIIEEQQRKQAQNALDLNSDDEDTASYRHVFFACRDYAAAQKKKGVIACASSSLVLLCCGLVAACGGNSLSATAKTVTAVVAGAAAVGEAAAAVLFCRSKATERVLSDTEDVAAQLIEWFITTYDHKQIDAAVVADCEDAPGDAITELRKEKICSYLLRENEHLDDAFLSYLAEQIYPLVYISDSEN